MITFQDVLFFALQFRPVHYYLLQWVITENEAF